MHFQFFIISGPIDRTLVMQQVFHGFIQVFKPSFNSAIEAFGNGLHQWWNKSSVYQDHCKYISRGALLM